MGGDAPCAAGGRVAGARVRLHSLVLSRGVHALNRPVTAQLQTMYMIEPRQGVRSWRIKPRSCQRAEHLHCTA